MLLDTLFGQRLYVIDPQLGKFYSEKKLKHSSPIVWSHSQRILGNSNLTMLQFEGNRQQIYPNIKDEYFYFTENYNTVIRPFINDKIIEYKDLLSFEKLNYQFAEIYGRMDKEEAVLEFLGREMTYNYLMRFSLVNQQIRGIFIT